MFVLYYINLQIKIIICIFQLIKKINLRIPKVYCKDKAEQLSKGGVIPLATSSHLAANMLIRLFGRICWELFGLVYREDLGIPHNLPGRSCRSLVSRLYTENFTQQ